MKFLANKRLATRISIITSAVTLVGLLLLWIVVSTNAASMVKNDITNQMTDAVESWAAIINEYVASAEEYMAAFALGSEVQDLLLSPGDPELLQKPRHTRRTSPRSKAFSRGSTLPLPILTC